jgi:biotin carboxyl carrier protein
MIIEVGIGDEQPRRYQVRRAGDHAVVRHLDDGAAGDGDGAPVKETSIDWRRPQPGIYSLLIDDVSYEVFVEEEPDHLAVHLVSRTFRVHAADMRRHRHATAGVGAADGLVRITAPIPGRVSRILVEPGEQIARGDGVVVVEAMKMENELRAPRDGVVGSIEVEEGQGVEGGALLATIE